MRGQVLHNGELISEGVIKAVKAAAKPEGATPEPAAQARAASRSPLRAVTDPAGPHHPAVVFFFLPGSGSYRPFTSTLEAACARIAGASSKSCKTKLSELQGEPAMDPMTRS